MLMSNGNAATAHIPSHSHCLLCGQQNPLSMRLKFAKLAEGKVGGHFVAHQHLQGYRGIIHGGVICSLLDSVMTNCLFLHGIEALTGEMTIKFLHSVPCDAQIELMATIEKAFEPLYIVTSELHSNNSLMATASAKFMKKPE